MRIDNGSNPIEPNSPPRQTQAASKVSGESVAGNRDGALTSVNVGSIDGLLQLIVNKSEIRESVVNEIKTKIQTGEYLAKQSALETASSILNL